jgi:hypothetical protein
MGARVGAAQLMSHHMSNFIHTSDDECLSLVALLAFERAAFHALCVHRLDQSDRSLPPHAGHSATAPMGADRGACTLYPFALEGSASPCKVQVRLGRLMMASRSYSSLDPLTDRICIIWNTSPTLRLGR